MARTRGTGETASPSLPKVPRSMEVPMLRGLISQLIEAVHQLRTRVDHLQATVDRLQRPAPRVRRPARRSRG